jgi:hypothetical protein
LLETEADFTEMEPEDWAEFMSAIFSKSETECGSFQVISETLHMGEYEESPG